MDNIFDMSNSIGYKGTVKIVIQYTNGREKTLINHNEGKLPLFTAVCRALAGYNIDKYKPSCLMCYNSNNDSLLSSKVVCRSTPSLFNVTSGYNQETTENCDCIEYVFILPLTMIAKTNGKIQIEKFALLNLLNETCATIDLNLNPIVIESGINVSNLLVYWQLQFSNAIETSSENQNQGE